MHSKIEINRKNCIIDTHNTIGKGNSRELTMISWVSAQLSGIYVHGIEENFVLRVYLIFLMCIRVKSYKH